MIQLDPTRAQMFTDNAQVAAFARAVGSMDHLLDSSGLVHAVTGALNRQHPSHWLLFLCFTGMSDPADNGLLLTTMPKSRFTEAQAHAQLQAAIAKSDPAFVRNSER